MAYQLQKEINKAAGTLEAGKITEIKGNFGFNQRAHLSLFEKQVYI